MMGRLDPKRIYWFWHKGRQVQLSYDTYSGTWAAFYNDSGKPL